MTVADRPAGRSLADLARSGDQRHLAMPARMIGSFCRISLWSKNAANPFKSLDNNIPEDRRSQVVCCRRVRKSSVRADQFLQRHVTSGFPSTIPSQTDRFDRFIAQPWKGSCRRAQAVPEISGIDVPEFLEPTAERLEVLKVLVADKSEVV